MVKPSIDTRDREGEIASRVGIKAPCISMQELCRIVLKDNIQYYDCIIVDEAQFLTKDEVDLLADIVDECDVPVICYGLKADFKGELFEGSKRLLEIADKINEIKTVCWCGKKAIMNARFNQKGEVLKEGEQVVIGADEQYTGLCRKHWKWGVLNNGTDS